jgi:hypothetical protein
MAFPTDYQRFGVERLYCGLSPEIAQRAYCVILETFIDESENKEFYIVGGYVAPMERWKAFDAAWYDALKIPPRLGFYRTSDAIALKGQFERFDAPSRDQRIATLARIIPNDLNCWGVSCWVSKEDFKTFCEPVFHPAWHDPYYLCATYLIERLCYEVRGLDPNKLEFIFDRQGKIGKRFKLVYDAFLKPVSMMLFPFLGKVRHEDKEEFLPLQAADMGAGYARRFTSAIQVWTAADAFLKQIDNKQYPIPRAFLEYIKQYGTEHADEIAAMWVQIENAAEE